MDVAGILRKLSDYQIVTLKRPHQNTMIIEKLSNDDYEVIYEEADDCDEFCDPRMVLTKRELINFLKKQ